MITLFKQNIGEFLLLKINEIDKEINSADCDIILNTNKKEYINKLVSKYKLENINVNFKEIKYTQTNKQGYDYYGNPDETFTVYSFEIPFAGDKELLNFCSHNGRNSVTHYYLKNENIYFESLNFELEYNHLNKSNKLDILKSIIFNINKECESWNENLEKNIENYFNYRKDQLIELNKFCKKYGLSKDEIKKMKFKLAAIEALSVIIADNYSGSEITTLFKKAGFPEIIHDGTTKWKFICATFEEMQEESIEGFYKILKVLEVVCNPQEYLLNPNMYENILKQVNIVLSFYGFKFNDEGTLIMLEEVNKKLESSSSKRGSISEKSWDVFISYSSKDSDWVSQFYDKLKEKGLKIWYDQSKLSIGDNVRKNINMGLNNCKFGIVVLSQNFIDSFWPNREYDSLYPLMEDDRLLPINLGLSKKQLEEFDKPLINIIYRDTNKFSVEEIVDEIYDKISNSFD